MQFNKANRLLYNSRYFKRLKSYGYSVAICFINFDVANHSIYKLYWFTGRQFTSCFGPDIQCVSNCKMVGCWVIFECLV